MKIKYLIAGMLACLMSFSSCGSDDDPTPDKPGEIVWKKVLSVQVNNAGTLKDILNKTIIEHFEQKSNATIGDFTTWADSLIIKGNLNMKDIIDLTHIYDISNSYEGDVYIDFSGGLTCLDLSDVQIEECTLNGVTYPANTLARLPEGTAPFYNKIDEFTSRGVANYIILPKSLVSIESNTFLNIRGNIEIPENIKEIGDSAFYNSNFTVKKSIHFSGIRKLGKSAFENTEIKASYEMGIDRDEIFFNLSTDGQLSAIPERAFLNFSEIECKMDLQGVVEIGERAFAREKGSISSSSIEISIPDVKYLKPNCFFDHGSVVTITDMHNLIEIGDSAFYQSSHVQLPAFPNSLEKIGVRAFLADNYIFEDSLIIPENVKQLGVLCFDWQCFSTVHMRSKLPPVKIMDQGLNYHTILCDTLYVPKSCKNIYMEGAHKYNENSTSLSCGIDVKTGIILEE